MVLKILTTNGNRRGVIMSEFHDVIIPDGQPCFQFYHIGQEYCVYAWLEDSSDRIYTFVLAEVIVTSGGYGTKNVIAETANETAVNNAGGVLEFMNTKALPKFNTYLQEQGSGDNPFPEDGIHKDQFNWVVKNALVYANEKLIMVM